MKAFLEHFAFIVFLFACISHYVANAEICSQLALLESFTLICRHTVNWCVCLTQLCDSSAASMSLSLLLLNTWGRPRIVAQPRRWPAAVTAWVSLIWRKKCAGKFNASKPKIFNPFFKDKCCLRRMCSLEVMQYLIFVTLGEHQVYILLHEWEMVKKMLCWRMLTENCLLFFYNRKGVWVLIL